jgi:3-oxoacyl-[acyl-carrier-protein] synthase-3
MHSRIAGTGSYLPERIVTNDALADRVATSDEWIRSRTGIRQRHVAADGEQTSDLALAAVRNALAAASLAPADVDLIVVATTTPDIIFPSTASILQAKLGTAGGAAFDVQAVCSGFVYALAIADRMVAGGIARNAIVVGAEVYSRILDWNDRSTCVLLATVRVQWCSYPRPSQESCRRIWHSDGRYKDTCVPGR